MTWDNLVEMTGVGKSDKSENIFTICANVWIIFITFAHDSIETVADEFT